MKKKDEKSKAKHKAENTTTIQDNWPINTPDKMKLL